MVSLGAALAAASTLEDAGMGGKVVLFGTPAEGKSPTVCRNSHIQHFTPFGGQAAQSRTPYMNETLPFSLHVHVTHSLTEIIEGGGGKIKLLNAGAYKDNNVDISLITHPGITPDSALMSSAAYNSFKVEYFGKEAHAAARPWDGINALDALITAYNAISVLRQQTQPGDIIQGMITNGGLRPNIIHAYAAGRFVARSDTKARVATLKKRVFACFEAGATATGATLKITEGTSYDDHMPNHVLGRSFRHSFNRLGGDIPTGELDYIVGRTQASTDQGE
jgi:metal-dependent amidase/aminoacylase/carboxypeptidase family protein